MIKLEEGKKKIEDMWLARQQMDERLTLFLDKHKDNSILQEYIQLLNMRTDVDKEIKSTGEELYQAMEVAGQDELDSKILSIKCKHSYIKREINQKKFLEKYGPETPEYKEFVQEKQVKGNIMLKDLKE